MTVRLYRKRPIVVEAIEYCRDNLVDVLDFIRKGKVHYLVKSTGILLRTPSGDMLVKYGDFVVRGLNAEYYPCTPEAFTATYECLGGR